MYKVRLFSTWPSLPPSPSFAHIILLSCFYSPARIPLLIFSCFYFHAPILLLLLTPAPCAIPLPGHRLRHPLQRFLSLRPHLGRWWGWGWQWAKGCRVYGRTLCFRYGAFSCLGCWMADVTFRNVGECRLDKCYFVFQLIYIVFKIILLVNVCLVDNFWWMLFMFVVWFVDVPLMDFLIVDVDVLLVDVWWLKSPWYMYDWLTSWTSW